jgi:ribosomal-protein-alanine N-acetyltransferase
MVHVVDDSGWRMALPRLDGESVRVRELVAADAAALLELLTDSAVSAHISTPPPSLAAFEGFIAWTHRERASGSSVCFGLVPTGLNEAVGVIQIRALDPSFFIAEWGFAIGAAFWGTGVFVEGAALAARFAFDVIGVHRLEARAVTHNGRGNGALQKLGAKPEGVLSKAFKTGGGYLEQLLWALTSADLASAPSDRFSGARARARVATAIADTRRLLQGQQPDSHRPSVTPYPFFVAGLPGTAMCPRCRAPIQGGRCRSCGPRPVS